MPISMLPTDGVAPREVTIPGYMRPESTFR